MEKTITNKIKSLVDIYQYTPQAKPAHKEEWRKSIEELKRSLDSNSVKDSKWLIKDNEVGSIGQGWLSKDEIANLSRNKKAFTEFLNIWLGFSKETLNTEIKKDSFDEAFKKEEDFQNRHPALLHRIAYALFPDKFCNTLTDGSLNDLLELLSIKEEFDNQYGKGASWYAKSYYLRGFLNELKADIGDYSWHLYDWLKNRHDLKDAFTNGNKAIILYGVPGTGKTYMAQNTIKALIHEEHPEMKTEDIEHSKYYNVVQFHPNYTYEDFIGGISPVLDKAAHNISYEYRDGVFSEICKKALEDKNKNFYLLIDEINRADLSAVFGELLYALEYRDKPIHSGNSEETFIVPSNVCIIGTMNNLDKSLVNFDLALRRRFRFKKLEVNLNSLYDILPAIYTPEAIERYITICSQLNSALAKGLKLDAEYQIGQAYFGKIKEFESVKDKKISTISKRALQKVWEFYIEPLITEEYLGVQAIYTEVQKTLTQEKNKFIDQAE